jgi:hypothetical protein
MFVKPSKENVANCITMAPTIYIHRSNQLLLLSGISFLVYLFLNFFFYLKKSPQKLAPNYAKISSDSHT